MTLKTAIVTGAHGFLGRHLARSLSRLGTKVIGLGHGTWTDAEYSAWGIHYWIKGDVSKSNLEIAQAELGTPEAIFHLAGGSAVGPSLFAPEEDFRRSVLSAAELLEWARSCAPGAPIVFASSAAVYGANHAGPICELTPVKPYSPYGTHKRIAEELLESYARNFALKVSIVRLFSIYGEELKKQLLWDVCTRLSKHPDHLTLGGTGTETRDWVHVSDAVELLQIGVRHASHNGPIINGGTGVSTSVREVVSRVIDCWGYSITPSFSGTSRAGDPNDLVANISLANSLGYHPRIDWHDGIADYVHWFKRTHRGIYS